MTRLRKWSPEERVRINDGQEKPFQRAPLSKSSHLCFINLCYMTAPLRVSSSIVRRSQWRTPTSASDESLRTKRRNSRLNTQFSSKGHAVQLGSRQNTQEKHFGFHLRLSYCGFFHPICSLIYILWHVGVCSMTIIIFMFSQKEKETIPGFFSK